MIELLIYILVFTVYLLPQALLINGVYISAYGRTDILPDGSHADSEMILYPLYKFLNQNKSEKIFYTNKRLLDLHPSLEFKNCSLDFYNQGSSAVVFNVIVGALLTKENGINLAESELRTWAERELNAKTIYNTRKNTVAFYQYETRYKFSKYLRKPIITCVICMASFWSIFTFLIPAICYFGFDIKILPLWIANVFCLSYLNYLIYKSRP